MSSSEYDPNDWDDGDNHNQQPDVEIGPGLDGADASEESFDDEPGPSLRRGRGRGSRSRGGSARGRGTPSSSRKKGLRVLGREERDKAAKHHFRDTLEGAEKQDWLAKEQQRDHGRKHNYDNYLPVNELAPSDHDQRKTWERERKAAQRNKKRQATAAAAAVAVVMPPAAVEVPPAAVEVPHVAVEVTPHLTPLPMPPRRRGRPASRGRGSSVGPGDPSRSATRSRSASRGQTLRDFWAKNSNAASNARIAQLETTVNKLKRTLATERQERSREREKMSRSSSFTRPPPDLTPNKRADEFLRSAGARPDPSAQRHVASLYAVTDSIRQKIRTEPATSPKSTLLVATSSTVTERNLSNEVALELTVDGRTVDKYSAFNQTPPATTTSRALPDETKDTIVDFFLREDNSAECPGIKDTKTVKGVKYQRRILQDYMTLLHLKFESENPDINISYNKFCTLRPPYVRAPTEADRLVCLCVYHTNVELKLEALRAAGAITYTDTNEAAEAVLCDEDVRTDDCWKRICKQCEYPNTPTCFIPEDVDVDLLKPMQWRMWKPIENERGFKELQKMPQTGTVEGCMQFLATDLDSQFVTHQFVTRTQFRFVRRMREHLAAGTVLVQMDFAENFTTAMQDEPAARNWTQQSITIHPFVLHYYCPDGTIKVQSFACVTDNLEHQTHAVLAFQKILFAYLAAHPDLMGPFTKVVYLTDGAAAQYKNCHSFLNLCQHEENFGVPAMWVFFATSHGKNNIDGVGAVLKREARDGTIKRTYHITDGASFVDQVRSKKVIMLYVPMENIAAAKAQMNQSPPPITFPGTLGFHLFKPVGRDQPTALRAWTVACCCDICVTGATCPEQLEECDTRFKNKVDIVPSKSRATHFRKQQEQQRPASPVSIPAPPVGTKVAAIYAAENAWFVATVIDPDSETADDEVKVEFFVWSIKPTFKKAERPETQRCDVPVSQILLCLTNNDIAISGTGDRVRTSVSSQQMAAAEKAFAAYEARKRQRK